LLLNIPPDQRGLFHENDSKALKGFREILNREFAVDLAKGKKVKASSYRGNAKQFAPDNITDGNKNTYWATDDNVLTGSFEIDLGKISTVKYILLQEYIRLGQRVKSFTVEVWKNNSWQRVAEGTTIGYKRILAITPVQTNKVRVNIADAKACAVISNVEAY
jgi:alpha-L-fucosidase